VVYVVDVEIWWSGAAQDGLRNGLRNGVPGYDVFRNTLKVV